MNSQLEEELARKRIILSQDEGSSLAKLESVLHHKVSGAYLADMVFGANDGIITTFAVVAGAQGAALSPWIILVMGCANLLADGISMGAGNYLGTKSEIDYQKRQRQKEEWEVENFPAIEEEEIRDIFKAKGFTGDLLEQAVRTIISDKKRWVDLMMLEELKIIEERDETPTKRGIVTFVAFTLAGAIPLIPFLFTTTPQQQFIYSSVLAGITMFTIGALRSKVTVRHWLHSGIEMFAVGAVAATAAYVIGSILGSFGTDVAL